MRRGDKSKRDGIEDFLCPFTDMYITQGSNGGYSHQGIMANDVRGLYVGERYPYFAPCTCKCIKVYPDSGQSMWQSIEKVRFANGRIDYATIMIAHDDSQDCYVGEVVEQGNQLGNMGMKGNATGVHCHIQVSQSKDESWYKNNYGVYQFNNEYDLDDCYFVDNTNILNGMGGNWKLTSDVDIVEEELYECLYNMYVRSEPYKTAPTKLFKELTPNGKENALHTGEYDPAVYKNGTIFTCYEKIRNDDGLWARSPSGYICIKDNNTIFCKRV